MPADVRDLLTGVHYRVIGYENSAKRRPVGSLDAIVKVAQVYLLKAEKANITEVAEKMLDHAVGTPNGMTKIVSTLKARVMTAIEQEDDSFGEVGLYQTSSSGVGLGAEAGRLKGSIAAEAVCGLADVLGMAGSGDVNFWSTLNVLSRIRRRTFPTTFGS